MKLNNFALSFFEHFFRVASKIFFTEHSRRSLSSLSNFLACRLSCRLSHFQRIFIFLFCFFRFSHRPISLKKRGNTALLVFEVTFIQINVEPAICYNLPLCQFWSLNVSRPLSRIMKLGGLRGLVVCVTDHSTDAEVLRSNPSQGDNIWRS